MVKEAIEGKIKKAYQMAVDEGSFQADRECPEVIFIEKPKTESHGDFACGVSLKLARHLKLAPMKIAETLKNYIEKVGTNGSGAMTVEAAQPGFLNFQLDKSFLSNIIYQIANAGENFGRGKSNGKKILIEYVSANPTGGLHIGHGRNAILGSSLANLLSFAGWHVVQEFYINDCGEQINKLARSAFACYQKKLGNTVEYPEDGYPEESLSPYVDKAMAEYKSDPAKLEKAEDLGDIIKEYFRADQEKLLLSVGVKFDSWFSETSLHKDGKVEEALAQMASLNYTYDSEGAYWLKAKELGDERDRVLKKSTGATTYLANDAAYHLNKYKRGFDLMVNIWGADHHGQVPGLKAVVKALGEDPDKLELLLTQIVNLNRDGKPVKMSKRMGTVVMLDEVLEEVGADAVRYYLAESNPNNPINFDLELAKKTSKDNPAFYIQYAHARCCSILRRAGEEYLDSETGKMNPPRVSPEQMREIEQAYGKDERMFDFTFDNEADNPEAFAAQKKLVLRLSSLPDEVEEAARVMQPGRIARYSYEIACDLQRFYEVSRVLCEDLSVTRSRLGLIMATRQVLRNTLKIIGVSAPERM